MSNSKKDIAIADLRTFLEDAYPIGKIISIESITCDEEELLRSLRSVDALPEAHQLSTGELRSSFRVSTESKEYFLKRVSAWVEDDQLVRIEHFITWTGEKKLDLCPALIQASSGETHIKMRGERFQLFEFIEQEKRQIWMRSHLSQSDCALTGNLLARLHLASVEYLGEKPEMKDSFSIDWDYQASCDRLFQRIKGEVAVSNPTLSRVSKQEHALKDRFFKAKTMMDACGKFAVPLLVHGDFHPGNVLFFKGETGSTAVRLVDFDYLRKESPLYDVGYGLIMFALGQPAMESRSSEQISEHLLDWQLEQAFVRGYIKALHKYPAEKDEFKILKAEVMAACIMSMLPCYVTIACFLIMDWAVENLINGPRHFNDVYVDVVEKMETLVCSDVEQKVESIWIEELVDA